MQALEQWLTQAPAASVDVSAPHNDLSAANKDVVMGTEFVSFEKPPVSPVDHFANGALPPTVMETRRASGEVPVQKKQKSARKEGAASAAAKALDFIETELSLSKK